MATLRIMVTGMVQGIGYRPYVARLAEALGICGEVWNASGVVIIIATANRALLDRMVENLKQNPPPGAQIGQIICEELPLRDFRQFRIVKSTDAVSGQADPFCSASTGTHVPMITPDLPVCAQCVREVLDPQNRRYGYPFISCTACGPRYSILRKIPYDRCNTSLSVFDLCVACEREYKSSLDVRRHAQTISCHDCGPQLIYCGPDTKNRQYGQAALKKAVTLLQSGGIVAVKDIGGFHLACSPYCADAVQRLRRVKGREKKPFAVMFETTESALDVCVIGRGEKKLLESFSRPVVLVKRRENFGAVLPFAGGVCASSPYIGAMLYCNPLQLLLLRACGPLVMTSANASGEPMIISNDRMMQWAAQRNAAAEGKIGILMHDRDIQTPLDDSVVFEAAGRALMVRRSRGYVPQPVFMSAGQNGEEEGVGGTVFAAGGDLKASFCYSVAGRAYLSQPFGDLQQEAVYDAYLHETARMSGLLELKPDRYVCDLHPLYTSAAFTENLAALASAEQCRVQHHHAHIASVIAEHRLSGRVLGVAFDGTGFGTDQTIWGSEFLWCEHTRFDRAGHLENILLPGADESARNADLSLFGYLLPLIRQDIGDGEKNAGWLEAVKQLEWIDTNKLIIAEKAVAAGINTVSSSSMGRLFDAVSALLNICHENRYEGEAAMHLEYAAVSATEVHPLKIALKRNKDGHWVGDTKGLFVDLIKGLLRGTAAAVLANGFISAVADFTVEMCRKLTLESQQAYPKAAQSKMRNMEGLYPIALSGGCFQNRLLLERTIVQLEELGYQVYMNEQVPAGDGGLALGQAYLAQGGV